MDLQIQGRNIEITDQVRRHIEDKLSHLARQLTSLSNVSVELSSESTRSKQDRVVAQVTLNVAGSILRAEQRAPDTKTAITSASEVLSRRIERYKSQTYRSQRSRQNASLGTQQAEEAALAEPPADGEVLPGGDVVKIKRFGMKPLTVEEAVFQMQLLGHAFYMFLNSETDRHNVLYQRDDGNYGLIQPSE